MDLDDLFDKVLHDKFLAEIVSLLFYGGGLIAILKVTIWFYSQKLFSFYYVYRNRSRFENHYVFHLIEELYKKNNISFGVMDPTKKQILSEIFELELIKARQVLKINLTKIIRPTWKEYLNNWGNFLSEKIIMDFYLEYLDTRNSIESLAKNRFISSGMSVENFLRLWGIYREISHDFEIVIGELLLRYKSMKDLYRILHFILDDFQTLIEIQYKTLPSKFNRMNGRSYGIEYKGGRIGE